MLFDFIFRNAKDSYTRSIMRLQMIFCCFFWNVTQFWLDGVVIVITYILKNESYFWWRRKREEDRHRDRETEPNHLEGDWQSDKEQWMFTFGCVRWLSCIKRPYELNQSIVSSGNQQNYGVCMCAFITNFDIYRFEKLKQTKDCISWKAVECSKGSLIFYFHMKKKNAMNGNHLPLCQVHCSTIQGSFIVLNPLFFKKKKSLAILFIQQHWMLCAAIVVVQFKFSISLI